MEQVVGSSPVQLWGKRTSPGLLVGDQDNGGGHGHLGETHLGTGVV